MIDSLTFKEKKINGISGYYLIGVYGGSKSTY